MAKSLKSFLAKKYPEAIGVNMVTDVTYIDTRIPTLNYVISGKPKSGGIPLNGKIVCLYGPEACLEENTIIEYQLTKNTSITTKCTIKEFYELFQKYKSIMIKSIDYSHDNVIFNSVFDVVKTGVKECFEVITKNDKEIITTKDHKFYIGNNEFKKLEDLKVNDFVYTLSDNYDLEPYYVVRDEIISITKVGEKETYDVKCFAPYNNYIANDFAVHNSGKTSLILQFIREAQKKNIEVVFLDTERSITQNRARQFGIDFDKMIYASPDTMEECFMMIEDIYKEKADTATLDEPIVIIWDSLAATPTNAETNRTADQVEIASQAGVLTRNLRRIRGKIKKMNAGVILIQQARANQDRYGDLFSMPGGYALHHTVDLILRVNKMKANESEMGVKISTPQKNRLFKPFQNTVIQFDYTNGFTKENIIVAFCEFLRNIEILGSAGAWCYLQTDVDDIIKKDPSLTEKEAKAQVKKFYLKDFASRLVEDENYFNEMLEVAEDYVNKNISKVAKIMVDDEVPIDVLESNPDGIEVEGEAALSKT